MLRIDFKSLRFLIAVLLAVFMLATISTAVGPQGAASSASAQYVGSETCKGCHEEVHKGFEPNPHFQLLGDSKKKTGTTEWHGCESCHGPGSAHVEGGGDKTKIVVFKDLSAKQASEQCLQCHQGGHEQNNFARSAHLAN